MLDASTTERDDDELMNAKQTARFLKLSDRTFERRVKDLTVPEPIWIGAQRRWWKSVVKARFQHKPEAK